MTDADAADALLRQAVAAALPDPPGKVGVAVSGGGDSMALLHLAQSVLPEGGVEAVTVDHGLRPESADEAAGVAAHCARIGVPHRVLRWTGWDGQGNLPAAAREARYRLIGDWARGRGIGRVLLGHTADDVAETFLMRLGRAAGVDGLAAMEARFEREWVQWARPLWQQRRADLRAYLARHGIAYVDDPSNEDMERDRPRIRAALPGLAKLGLGVEQIVHSARALDMARGALDHYARVEAGRVVTTDRGDVLIDLAPRPPIPDEIARRLLVAALGWVGQGGWPPRQSALNALDAALGEGGQHTVAGCLVRRTGDDLRITREHNAVRGLVTATTEVWDGRWRIEGPHVPGLRLRALGAAVATCSGWRETGLPRASLMASPAVWRGETLVAAPLAGDQNGWSARIVADFHSWLVTH